MSRKPVDTDAAMARGLDYLLREFKALDLKPAADLAADSGQFTGPIEVTYLVCAHNCRSALRALADFVCSGSADEEEIQAALDLCNTAGYGRVVMSDGGFNITADARIDVYTNCSLTGVGNSTVMETNGDLDIVVASYATVRDFRVVAASC